MVTTIHVDSLVKEFGDFRAVDELDLEVEEGTVHGFLGPNGSGKSTTIRSLLGLLKPTSGSVSLLGQDPGKTPGVLRRVGYVPGDVALWPSLTGWEILRSLETMRHRPANHEREKQLIDAFDLDPTKRAREYSTGNRRKVSLVAALSIDAEVLILDEPTAGLDPLMEDVFISQIQALAAEGTTVLLSSHILSEVEKLCSSVTVIKSGRVVESGDLSRIRHLSDYHLSARLPTGASVASLQNHADVSVEGDTVRLVAQRDTVPDALSAIIDLGATDITSQPASLEEIFLRHYETDAPHDGGHP